MGAGGVAPQAGSSSSGWARRPSPLVKPSPPPGGRRSWCWQRTQPRWARAPMRARAWSRKRSTWATSPAIASGSAPTARSSSRCRIASPPARSRPAPPWLWPGLRTTRACSRAQRHERDGRGAGGAALPLRARAGHRRAGRAVRVPAPRDRPPQRLQGRLHARSVPPDLSRARLSPGAPRDLQGLGPGHPGVPRARLSARLRPCHPAPSHGAAPHDHRGAALLHEHHSADLRVDGASRPERHREPVPDDAGPHQHAAGAPLQPGRRHHRHELRTPAVHGADRVQRDARHRPGPRARRPQPGREPAPGLPARVPAALASRHRRRHSPRLHPEPGLLHHAGAHGRPRRRHDRHAHRAGGGDHAELVVRLCPGRGPARADPARFRGLQPAAPAGSCLRGPWMTSTDGQRNGPGAVVITALAGAVLLFLIAPVAIMVIVSLSGADYLSFPPPYLSLRWYQRFLGTPSWRQAIWVSTQVAGLTMLFATALGLLAAHALVRGRFRGKGVIYAVLLSPLIVPTIITAIGLYFFFVRLKATGSIFAMALGHTVLALPVVVIIMAAALQGFDIRLEQAALSLGASRLTALRRITLPLILPGLLSAALFAFLTSFDELLIPLFLSGVEVQTLTVRVWNSLVLEVDPTIAAVSSFLIGVTTVVLGASALLRGRGDVTPT